MNMRIAVVNETSAGDKNKDILMALEGFDHEICNVGMREKGAEPELTYIETGLLTALLLNTGAVDFVVGGCGTGQGYVNSAMQYPGVFCGLIMEPSDAWLFAQINGGNCISFPLNKGYGWAGDINLKFIFEKLFSVPFGYGYPEHRQASQQQSRKNLMNISSQVHLSMEDILDKVNREVLLKTLSYPGVMDILTSEVTSNEKLVKAIQAKYDQIKLVE